MVLTAKLVRDLDGAWNMGENKLDDWERRDTMGNTKLLVDLHEMKRQLREILRSVQGKVRFLRAEHD